MLDQDKYSWLTSLCAMAWYLPQAVFNFGECKEEKKPQAVSYLQAKSETVKQLRGEIRSQNIKAATRVLLPFLKIFKF